MIEKQKKSHIGLYIVGTVFVGMMIVGFIIFSWLKQLTPEDIIGSDFFKHQVQQYIGDEHADIFNVAPFVLGLHEPHTILFVFLNNTELRPGGGFIGAYATVRFDTGQMELLALEGTEILDKQADKSLLETPPQILQKKLGVDKWYFRDRNWSPDFAESAERLLETYTKEGGVAAQDIDTVVGVTTDVLEDILALTGSVTVEGITFTSEDVIEKLEYEVEYGYADRGITFADRKSIMRPFMLQLVSTLSDKIVTRAPTYFDLVETLGKEKHLLVYSKDTELQKHIDSLGWNGEMGNEAGDYLLWVDANLAALKTDHAMVRDLEYRIEKKEKEYVGHATMHYDHQGSFDWRTTRYLSYARVYVPLGAKIASVHVGNESIPLGTVDRGIEKGRQWFGVFVRIEPGSKKDVTFAYTVSEKVAESIEKGLYTLGVQKQLGTKAHGLTLSLDFDTSIKAAMPAEEPQNWGDSVYTIKTDLQEDRNFSISF